MIPVLYTTYNRLDYTRQTLPQLLRSTLPIHVYVIDNASTDGTWEWLQDYADYKPNVNVAHLGQNIGIVGAMNIFLDAVRDRHEYAAKVDNDTLVPEDCLAHLLTTLKRLSLDVVQAKHYLLRENWDKWTKNMPRKNSGEYAVKLHNHVGGSPIALRLEAIPGDIPPHDKLFGWTEYQQGHKLKCGFDEDTFATLLDMEADGKHKEESIPYKKTTGRL